MVLIQKIPILGICVGMQLMASNSEEGNLSGLGWINGEVKKISNNNKNLILPHMGWNTVELQKNDLFKNIKDPKFYFLHSYCFVSNEKNSILGSTFYGRKFTSVIRKDNIYGIQFHPEKSHENGIYILKNFANL